MLAQLKELKGSGEKITTHLIKEVKNCYVNTSKQSTKENFIRTFYSTQFIANLKANDERLVMIEGRINGIEQEINNIILFTDSLLKFVNTNRVYIARLNELYKSIIIF